MWHGSLDIICNGNVLIDIEPTTTDTDFSDEEVKHDNQSSSHHQILAKTIVSSFALKKPAPLISVSRNRIQLFMYIPESDILLEGAPVLLTLDNKLQLQAILFIWLLLNYNVFKEDLSKTIRRGMPVSNFKILVGDKLDIYETSIHFGGCKERCDKESETLEFFYSLGSEGNFSEK